MHNRDGVAASQPGKNTNRGGKIKHIKSTPCWSWPSVWRVAPPCSSITKDDHRHPFMPHRRKKVQKNCCYPYSLLIQRGRDRMTGKLHSYTRQYVKGHCENWKWSSYEKPEKQESLGSHLGLSPYWESSQKILSLGGKLEEPIDNSSTVQGFEREGIFQTFFVPAKSCFSPGWITSGLFCILQAFFSSCNFCTTLYPYTTNISDALF